MKILITVITLILVTISIASADDDCTRAFPKPVVNSSSNLIQHYYLEKISARIIKEHFQLVDSHQVTITQAGCHHFGIEYSFVLSHFATSEKWILFAANALMEEIQLVTNYNIKGVLTAIQKTIQHGNWKRGEPIEVIVGYETVIIDVVNEKDQSNKLKISIDIAL